MATPSRPRATTNMPVTAPDLNATSRPPARPLVAAAWAVRALARTETFMPMKPAAADRQAPMA